MSIIRIDSYVRQQVILNRLFPSVPLQIQVVGQDECVQPVPDGDTPPHTNNNPPRSVDTIIHQMYLKSDPVENTRYGKTYRRPLEHTATALHRRRQTPEITIRIAEQPKNHPRKKSP
jgi:hypothetical protein